MELECISNESKLVAFLQELDYWLKELHELTIESELQTDGSYCVKIIDHDDDCYDDDDEEYDYDDCVEFNHEDDLELYASEDERDHSDGYLISSFTHPDLTIKYAGSYQGKDLVEINGILFEALGREVVGWMIGSE